MREKHTMRGLCVLGLLVAVVGIIRADSSIFSGFLGCRFSQSVCRSNEECVDDRLFGTCQRLDKPRDPYQYALSSAQLHELERVIGNLIVTGSTWDELYTQCVLSNVLLSFRQHLTYDAEFCDKGGVNTDLIQDQLTDATVDLLKSYLDDYYRENQLQDPELDYPDYGSFPVQKKDEVVQVHKYLKSHKRIPSLSDEYQDEGVDYGDESAVSRDYYSQDPDLNDDQDFLQDLSPEKLKLLEEYLGPLTGEEDVVSDDELASSPIDYADLSYEDVVQSLPLNDDYAVMASIDVQDATLLDQLLQGKVSVSDLSDEQISHLSKYVDQILEPLRKYGVTDEDPMQITEEERVSSLEEPPVANPAEIEGSADDVIPAAAIKKEVLDKDVLKSASDTDFDVVKKVHPNEPKAPTTTSQERLSIVDLDEAYIKVKPPINLNVHDAAVILLVLEKNLGLDPDTFADIEYGHDEISFRVKPNSQHLNASEIARLAVTVYREQIKNESNYDIYDAGVGEYGSGIPVDRPQYFVLTFVLCGVILGIVLSVIAIYIVRRHLQSREKLAQLAGAADGLEASNDYQDLCRQRMQSKSSEKPEPLHSSRVGSVSASESAVRSPSSRSSTSSRSEEPVVSNMDISTGHIVLSYMEDHLKNKDRLDQEWEALCVYEAEPNSTSIASDPANIRKNKYSDVLPYDHSRVILTSATNVSGSDYMNASTITDHDPRNPAYICTQGPLPHTVADFWQMVWEQGSVVIVNLTKLTESGQTMCHRYWPEEGSDLYHIYEVHLVSEHIWCDEYLVRCFYLKNLQTNETRTVSQFHFVAWPDLSIPSSAKALLDFRRKVNKSFRGQNCPIVVHCSDGSGRSGCYCLLDMVLNRMSKGAKEIDIAATLEHIRDQRMHVVKTKEQFEFVLASVAEEVHAILKALPQ